MKKIFLFAALLQVSLLLAQFGDPAAYYNGFNWAQNSTALKAALATKITTTHTHTLSYDDIWDADKIIDKDPANSNNVLLVYGWENGTDGDVTNDISRPKNSNGGGSGEWNREHTYAKSLGTPDLGTSWACSDAHHLRASDVQRNGSRGSRKFASGTGNSGTTGANWYPGDQWKGDIARMMMYMYLRYNTRCLPKNVAVGTINATDPNMIDLLLQWNAEDPVSAFEDARNTYLGNANNTYGQGNRNPFIDNPYLATLIWGGPAAENRWPNIAFLSTEDLQLLDNVAVYPNPSNDHKINIQTEVTLDEINLVNINGQLIQQIKKPVLQNNTYTLENLPNGFYILKMTSGTQSTVKKVIVN
ncbi:endonuclease [Flavobacterium sp. 3HN19-14]|uniref:endonuclease n=1 Tax=Flavobacterium sp. 3HN19-14 TaxID=3448133 RepID=UPI003EE1DB22